MVDDTGEDDIVVVFLQVGEWGEDLIRWLKVLLV